jgi:hypothetical protein
MITSAFALAPTPALPRRVLRERGKKEIHSLKGCGYEPLAHVRMGEMFSVL